MTLDDLLPQVLIDVPNCPDSLAEAELQRAMGQFARDTQMDIRTVLTDAAHDGEDASIADPANTRILTVVSAEVDGVLVDFDWNGSEISVEAGSLVVKAAVVPTNNAVPVVFRLWTDAMVARAQGKLLLQNGKTWSNPNLGIERLREYTDQMHEARLWLAKGGTHKPLRVTAHPGV